MCSRENCERHEYDYGLCLPHLKEKWLEDKTLVVEKPQKKIIDFVEVTTTDLPLKQVETREEEESEESTDESA